MLVSGIFLRILSRRCAFCPNLWLGSQHVVQQEGRDESGYPAGFGSIGTPGHSAEIWSLFQAELLIGQAKQQRLFHLRQCSAHRQDKAFEDKAFLGGECRDRVEDVSVVSEGCLHETELRTDNWRVGHATKSEGD
jgi:hypothetical protein